MKRCRKVGSVPMYVEIDVEKNGQQSLQSRQTNRKGIAEVLKEFQDERCTLFLICNRSIVGWCTYHFTNENLVIEPEEGGGRGFFDRFFPQ
jgi:hypothetical protein